MAKEPAPKMIYTEIDLPEFDAIDKKQKENGDILYILKPKAKPTCCPECGSVSLYVHKSAKRNVKDLDMFEHRVGLTIDGKSYRCRDCATLIRAEYPSLEGRLTKRLADAIRRDSLSHTFSETAQRYHVSVTTVASIFNEFTDQCMLTHQLITPPVLGIDEVHLNDEYRGVFVCVDKNEGHVLEFTEKRTYPSVVNTLKSLKEPENLKLVTIDMWKSYKNAVQTVFPSAAIVVDHFHVIKNLIKDMDSVRAAICKGIKANERRDLKHSRFLMLRNHEDLSTKQGQDLKRLFNDYPKLENIYLLKESFRDIYANAKSSTEARQMFSEWCAACKENEITAYDSFINTVNEWADEIFAYFDYPDMERTNAQTESLNRKIRTIARDGRGYKFDVLRKKIILSKYVFEPSEKFSFNDFLEDD